MCNGYAESVRGRLGVIVALVASVPWSALAAQRDRRPAARTEVFAGSEMETYLRNLQVVGLVRAYPWGSRRFTAREVDRVLPSDSGHPWAARYDWRSPAPRRISVALVRPEVAARLNSGFPFGYNDGAVWAGRGVTASIQGGVVARWGPLAATLVPIASWASNAAFPLKTDGRTGSQAFVDGFHPIGVDHPQRFGDGPYAIRDMGQSTLEFSQWGVSLGVTSANEYWGPASEFPVALGNNAAGFPRVFAGTADPVDLWIVRFHLRTLFGRLAQSAYSPQQGMTTVRSAAGAIAVVVPRWPEGLELGVARFIQADWSARLPPLRALVSPFRLGKLDRGAANDSLRNNLASVYVRWAMRTVGVEVYGEYGTEDYRYDFREILVEPDHVSGYTIGIRQVEPRPGGRLRVLRAELQNTQAGSLVQDGRTREGGFYTHAGLRQGHTSGGQLLASEWGLGGAAAKVALDVYRPTGRWTVAWSRLLRAEAAGFTVASAAPDPRGMDVMHTLGIEGLFFRGRYDISVGATVVFELNRDFRRDAVNVNAVLAVRAALP